MNEPHSDSYRVCGMFMCLCVYVVYGVNQAIWQRKGEQYHVNNTYSKKLAIFSIHQPSWHHDQYTYVVLFSFMYCWYTHVDKYKWWWMMKRNWWWLVATAAKWLIFLLFACTLYTYSSIYENKFSEKAVVHNMVKGKMSMCALSLLLERNVPRFTVSSVILPLSSSAFSFLAPVVDRG